MSAQDDPRADLREGATHPRLAPRVFGHQAAESLFLAAHAAGRLHSGWLISGPEGIGKATLAYRLAAFLLADPPGDMFGGAPASADLPADDPDLRLVRAETHPRLFLLRRTVNPDTGRLRQQIVVDDARALKGFFQLSAADGGRRVVIVDAADDMNPAAANAILKLLEEPPPGAVLFLIAHQPGRLLPTIRSRCTVLPLAPLSPADLARALEGVGEVTPGLAELSAGSPGHAVRLLAENGPETYAALVQVFASLPGLDRMRAIRLADQAAARGAEEKFGMLIDLVAMLLARLARAGVLGPPAREAATGEGAVLARLCPDNSAAQAWADLAARALPRVRAGRAVNLDPAALILDMFGQIESVAQRVADR
jgi:DNA polymerase III subunit delta'